MVLATIYIFSKYKNIMDDKIFELECGLSASKRNS